MLYQFLPRLSDEDYATLEASIREHGVQVPVILDENASVIDGHHRKEIAERLGVDYPKRTKTGLSDAQKRTLALTLNIDRRHLTREQKRAVIASSIASDPELSDREHARRTRSDNKTVGVVRAELEKSEEIPHFSRRVDPRTGNQSQRASTASTPRRRPITDQAKDAGWEARKIAERLQKLRDDDRFSRNKEEVAALLKGHLMFTVEVCQDLLDELNQSRKD